MSVARIEAADRRRAVRSSSSSASSGSGKSTLRRAGTSADRGAVVATSAGPGRRRRERPGGHRATPSTCCTSSPASGCGAGRLTVVDATNVQPEAAQAAGRARPEHHVLPVAIVLDLPERVCRERNAHAARPRLRRRTSSGSQHRDLRRSLRAARAGGLPPGARAARRSRRSTRRSIEREPLWNDRRERHGPFDIIGDVHGCCDELEALLERLGYDVGATSRAGRSTPRTRRAGTAVFLGDLVDRGPDTPGVLRLVMGMVAAGHALCVPGNHDIKLLRELRGRKVQVTHGLAETLAQLDARAGGVPRARCERLPRRPRQPLRARRRQAGRRARRAEGGEPGPRLGPGAQLRALRRDDRRDRRVRPAGPLPLGGRLPRPGDGRLRPHAGARARSGSTARSTSTPAASSAASSPRCATRSASSSRSRPQQVWYEPARPLAPPRRPTASPRPARPRRRRRASASSRHASRGRVTIREENAAAALEVMSRFAVDPRWLIYLPPTMSPRETTDARRLLEHPAEAFAYYRGDGRRRGSSARRSTWARARSSSSAATTTAAARAVRRRRRQRLGVVYTRTGRRFFDDQRTAELLSTGSAARSTRPGCRDELDTDWLLLDCELMPWSAKAQELLRDAVRGGRAPRPARCCPPARGGARAGGRRAASTSATCCDRTRRRPRNADRVHATPTAATAGRSTGSTASRSRRSTCSPREGAATRDRDHAGTWRSPTGSSPPTRTLLAPTRRIGSSTSTDPDAARGRDAPGGRS